MSNIEFKRDSNGEVYVISTEKHKEKQKEIEFKRKFKQANLPLHLLDYNINTYQGNDYNQNILKLSKFIQNYSNKFTNYHLYLWSSENGTQKTTIASYVGRELLKQGFKVQFILMNKLIKTICEADFDKDPDIIDKYNRILNCDFLIIDDCFDPMKVTVYKSGYQIPFLDSFLRERLENLRKSTCFTSNISVDNIDDNVYTKSIKNLILRNINNPMLFSDSIYKERKGVVNLDSLNL